jgi:hypothetical protein
MMKNSLSFLFACFHAQYFKPYGAGTLMTVFTIVTEAPRDIALPFSVTNATLPAVENEAPA